jgi:putative oxidoreductase
MVQLFDAIGIGQWFRIFTGICELLTAILLLFPATIGIGALLGFGVMVGATIANIFILHHDFIHSSIPAIILALMAWTHRRQLLKLGLTPLRSAVVLVDLRTSLALHYSSAGMVGFG